MVKYIYSKFIFVKKFIIFFCLIAILLHLLQIIYAQRALYVQSYDAIYWKDRFEHSQWTLPLSKRIIGDDGLYAYIGYSLVNGGSIAGFNSEAPPLGKYLIGFSIKIFKNPFYYAIFFGVGSLVVFYIISAKLLESRTKALFPVAILFLDPLFFSQFWQSMLDISQLFFLLLNTLFIIFLINRSNLNKKNIYLFSLIAGSSLGFFSQAKLPIFLPVIMLLETFFFLSRKLMKEYVIFLISFCVAFLIPDIKFFLDGNSLNDLFKLEKYVVSFYLKSQVIASKIAVWSTLLLGKFPEINSGKIVNVEEWWAMWPLSAILIAPLTVIEIFRKNNWVWKGIVFFILFSFLTYTVFPFYPRYLLLILPFVYLFLSAKLFKFHSGIVSLIIVVVLLYGFFNSRHLLQDNPDKILNSFYYNFSNQYFHDVYQENIVKLQMTRDKFRLISQKTLSDAGVRAIKIKELTKDLNSREGRVKIRVEYLTQDLGSFSEIKEIRLLRDKGKWKINWDWNIILNNFLPGYRVEDRINLGKRGSIFDAKGKILAKDDSSYLVLFNPEKMNPEKEREMLKFLEGYGYKGDMSLQNAYLENVLPETYVPLMTFYVKISDKERNKLLSYPGIRLVPYPSRIYEGRINFEGLQNTLYDECCTRIYSSHNYRGIKDLEKEYDNILWGYSGGEISMKDDEGRLIRVILEKNKKDGEDVRLNL